MMKKQLIGLMVAGALAHPAYAMIDGTVDPNTTTSPFDGVGSITINGGTYSGVLIGDGYVLTAAHVVAGMVGNPGGVSFKINDGSGSTYSAAEVFVFDGYTGQTYTGDGRVHDDLAIIRLSSPVLNAPYYDLYTGDMKASVPILGGGSKFTMVGYGWGGDGVNGQTVTPNNSVKREGSNIVDKLFADDDGGGFNEMFQYTFDKSGLSDEAHVAGGDSGAPAFINDNGVWKIAGIMTFVAASSADKMYKYGALGGGTLVNPYADWIHSVINPVPEAETWAMMLVGLGLVGFAVNRRRGEQA